MRKSAGSAALPPIVLREPGVVYAAPTLAAGATIGCCPLLLRGSFKAGRSRANKWVGFFRRAVQLPRQSIEVPKLVIDAYGAKGRLRLRPEYLLDGLISQC